MKPSDPRPIICLDVETGGLDPRAHEILSIAAIRLDCVSLEEQARYVAHVHPERPDRVEPAARRVNGYSPEAWAAAGAVPLREAMRGLYRISGGPGRCDVAAHHAAFDLGFVSRALLALNPEQPPLFALSLCTLQLAKLLGWRDLSLRGACRTLHVPYERGLAHRAEYDAERVALILRALRRSRATDRHTDRSDSIERPGQCEHCGALLIWRGGTPYDAGSPRIPHRTTCPHAHVWSRRARMAAAEDAAAQGEPV